MLFHSRVRIKPTDIFKTKFAVFLPFDIPLDSSMWPDPMVLTLTAILGVRIDVTLISQTGRWRPRKVSDFSWGTAV